MVLCRVMGSDWEFGGVSRSASASVSRIGVGKDHLRCQADLTTHAYGRWNLSDALHVCDEILQLSLRSIADELDRVANAGRAAGVSRESTIGANLDMRQGNPARQRLSEEVVVDAACNGKVQQVPTCELVDGQLLTLPRACIAELHDDRSGRTDGSVVLCLHDRLVGTHGHMFRSGRAESQILPKRPVRI